jgi:hypothetical protein
VLSILNMLHTLRFSLQNAVYFIMLPFLVSVSFTFCAVVRGRAGRRARPRRQHYCHHDTKVKPEAATAIIELLMMGGKTPETY